MIIFMWRTILPKCWECHLPRSKPNRFGVLVRSIVSQQTSTSAARAILEVLKYLYEERKITASGHETLDTDPGIATSKGDYWLETYILGTDHYQIELLANLAKVPEAEAMVVVAFPKPKGGSGFPARVFAIVPQGEYQR